MVTSDAGKAATGDRRVRRTRATLQRALIELVEEKELPRISVSDVAERADVSRSTFYDHYRDVHELAEAACTTMIDDLIASLPKPGQVFSDPEEGPTEVLRDFFTHFAEHANLYQNLLGPHGSARIINYIRSRVTTAFYLGTHQADPDSDNVPSTDGQETPHDVSAAFGAGAIVGVATDWLQRGRPRTPAEMAALTWPLFVALDDSDRR